MKILLFAILMLSSHLVVATPLSFESVNWSVCAAPSCTTKSVTITAFSPLIPYVVFINVSQGTVRVLPSGRCGPGHDVITAFNSAVCRLNIGTDLTLTIMPTTTTATTANGTYVVDRL